MEDASSRALILPSFIALALATFTQSTFATDIRVDTIVVAIGESPKGYAASNSGVFLVFPNHTILDPRRLLW